MLPDLDVVTFKLGIPYASPWGHRGISHSLLLALLAALLLSRLSRDMWQRLGWSWHVHVCSCLRSSPAMPDWIC
jgi:inner membrane protein